MKSLTIKQLKSLQPDDWVWLVMVEPNVYERFTKKETYGHVIATYGDIFEVGVLESFPSNVKCLRYEDYERTWFAYKNKEEREGKYEQT